MFGLPLFGHSPGGTTPSDWPSQYRSAPPVPISTWHTSPGASAPTIRFAEMIDAASGAFGLNVLSGRFGRIAWYGSTSRSADGAAAAASGGGSSSRSCAAAASTFGPGPSARSMPRATTGLKSFGSRPTSRATARLPTLPIISASHCSSTFSRYCGATPARSARKVRNSSALAHTAPAREGGGLRGDSSAPPCSSAPRTEYATKRHGLMALMTISQISAAFHSARTPRAHARRSGLATIVTRLARPAARRALYGALPVDYGGPRRRFRVLDPQLLAMGRRRRI